MWLGFQKPHGGCLYTFGSFRLGCTEQLGPDRNHHKNRICLVKRWGILLYYSIFPFCCHGPGCHRQPPLARPATLSYCEGKIRRKSLGLSRKNGILPKIFPDIEYQSTKRIDVLQSMGLVLLWLTKAFRADLKILGIFENSFKSAFPTSVPLPHVVPLKSFEILWNGSIFQFFPAMSLALSNPVHPSALTAKRGHREGGFRDPVVAE